MTWEATSRYIFYLQPAKLRQTLPYCLSGLLTTWHHGQRSRESMHVLNQPLHPITYTGGPQSPENFHLWPVDRASSRTHTTILRTFLLWSVPGTPPTTAAKWYPYWPGVICLHGGDTTPPKRTKRLYRVHPIPTTHRAPGPTPLKMVFIALPEERLTCWFRSNLRTN